MVRYMKWESYYDELDGINTRYLSSTVQAWQRRGKAELIRQAVYAVVSISQYTAGILQRRSSAFNTIDVNRAW